MHLDVDVKQLSGLVYCFEKYKENGFVSAIIDGKKTSDEIESIFPTKRKICRKLHFDDILTLRRKINHQKNIFELIVLS